MDRRRRRSRDGRCPRTRRVGDRRWRIGLTVRGDSGRHFLRGHSWDVTGPRDPAPAQISLNAAPRQQSRDPGWTRHRVGVLLSSICSQPRGLGDVAEFFVAKREMGSAPSPAPRPKSCRIVMVHCCPGVSVPLRRVTHSAREAARNSSRSTVKLGPRAARMLIYGGETSLCDGPRCVTTASGDRCALRRNPTAAHVCRRTNALMHGPKKLSSTGPQGRSRRQTELRKGRGTG